MGRYPVGFDEVPSNGLGPKTSYKNKLIFIGKKRVSTPFYMAIMFEVQNRHCGVETSTWT